MPAGGSPLPDRPPPNTVSCEMNRAMRAIAVLPALVPIPMPVGLIARDEDPPHPVHPLPLAGDRLDRPAMLAVGRVFYWPG